MTIQDQILVADAIIDTGAVITVAEFQALVREIDYEDSRESETLRLINRNKKYDFAFS